MKKISLFVILMLLTAANLWAQETISISGTVMDEAGVELPGVGIFVKGNLKLSTTSDAEGRFKLKNIPAKSIVVFSFVGFKKLEKAYGNSSREKERIGLSPDVSSLNEVVVSGRGTQRKVSVVGSVTTVDVKDLQVPAVSVSNMLQGRVPGIIGVTRSGEPGANFSEFWVRGISTFGANRSALILIDGVEGDINNLDPSDIESFSVLKDASATAVYGVRGANGVVVITTKHGKAGSMKINFKANATYSYSPRMPEYADAFTYARLANEARVVRGASPIYSDIELDLFRYNLDADLYPNVNWRDQILKDYVINPSYNLNVSGGGSNARYYMSFGSLQNEAVFKQDPSVSKINNNVNYKRYNFRANIDADVTKSTVVSLNLESVFGTQNAPGDGTNNQALWSAQANLPPVMVPIRYSNGQLPTYGANADEMSPYVRLNYLGSVASEKYNTRANLSIKQKLDKVIPGWSAGAMFSLITNGRHAITSAKRPDLFYAIPTEGRNLDGSLITVNKLTQQTLTTSQLSTADRQYYFEATTNYEHTFHKDHRVSGLIHAYRQEIKNSTWATSPLEVLPKRYQALSGRLTYSFKDTYLFESNLGYTGSENFAKGKRYGLFPSVAAGWMPSQYKWFKDAIPVVSYLKFRASYGLLGNDRLNVRFPYLTLIGSSGSGTWGGTAMGETTTGATNMQWETSHKYNFGTDAKFFRDKIDLTVDLFKNKTKGIFQKRENIPDEVGMTSVLPYSNIGSMTSWGVDGTLAYRQKVNEDVNFTLRGNLTLARNNVDYWEQTYVYPYQANTGYPLGVYRGLVALGLFKDEEDVRSSPKQTFMEKVLPGDIKYKDVNGDGKIDNDDQVPLSFSNIPNFQYGFATEFSYKNFTLSTFFEGVSEVQFQYGGTGYYPYAWETRGNLLSIAAQQSNRWTPASYSGTTDTENPNARFPRLTYGDNPNNNRSSTFWMADGTYLRLKNVELTYRLPKTFVRRLGLQGITASVIGDNLHVWDKVKLWDPAQASTNGGVYPLQRMYTFQLYVNF